MAIVLTTKTSAKVDELISVKSLAKAFTNSSYDFLNSATIVINKRELATLGSYTYSGDNRFGTPDELGNAQQTVTLDKDITFTFNIEKKYMQDTEGTIFEASANLKNNIENSVIPEIDKYIFQTMVTKSVALGNSAVAAITASNAYTKFLDGQNTVFNALGIQEGFLAAVSSAFYNFLKLDTTFTLASEIAMNMRVTGQVGEVDGVKIVKVPTSKLPTNLAFVISHPMATVFAQKLATSRILTEVPGFDGSRVEYHQRMVAFVLDNKASMIYSHFTAASA
jgi:hypothetical protein